VVATENRYHFGQLIENRPLTSFQTCMSSLSFSLSLSLSPQETDKFLGII